MVNGLPNLYEIAIIICNFPLRIQLENKILTRVLMRERPVTPVKPLKIGRAHV